MDQQAIFLTVRLATLTTLILLAISIPLGYWLAYGRARWKPDTIVVSLMLARPRRSK